MLKHLRLGIGEMTLEIILSDMNSLKRARAVYVTLFGDRLETVLLNEWRDNLMLACSPLSRGFVMGGNLLCSDRALKHSFCLVLFRLFIRRVNFR